MTVRDRWDQLSKALGLRRDRPDFLGDATWRCNGIEEEIRRMKEHPAPPRWCVGCKRPECDHGCAYDYHPPVNIDEEDHDMSTAGRGIQGGPPISPLTIHEPIRPFGAPAVKPTISDAYRASAQDIATCLETMLATCEQARQTGLDLIQALNEAGDSHEDFVKNYVEIATTRASTVRDTWKKQLEDLTKQTSALKDALAAHAPAATTEGEQT
jgi:hypothetical protein